MARRFMPVLAATVAFVLVTFGFTPALNFLIRLRARHGGGIQSYNTYAFSGSWILGLLAAAAVLLGIWGFGRRRSYSQSR